MKESFIETIALISIILGLILLFFLILDYTPIDAHITNEDSNSYLNGVIVKKVYSENKSILYLEVESTKIISAYYDENINYSIGDTIKLKGEMYNGIFSVKSVTYK